MSNGKEKGEWDTDHFQKMLGKEIKEVVDMLDLSAPEKVFREDLIKRTRSLIKGSFPGCSVEVYGSWATGLALPSSDIDFVVLGCSHIPKENMLQTVAQSFEANNLQCTLVLPTARVPVVKFCCPQSGLRGDVTFDVSNWQSSVALVRNYLLDFSNYNARDLVVLMKLIMVLTGNNEVVKGGLSSYAVSLLVFAFLRNAKDQKKLGENPTLGQLLVGFLEHYGSFNHETLTVDVTSPSGYRKGKMQAMSSYKVNWCIQDPLSADNNVCEQSFAMSGIAAKLKDMAVSLKKAHANGKIRGAGTQACPILSQAIPGLHHFTKQRKQLQTQWQVQSWQMDNLISHYNYLNIVGGHHSIHSVFQSPPTTTTTTTTKALNVPLLYATPSIGHPWPGTYGNMMGNVVGNVMHSGTAHLANAMYQGNAPTAFAAAPPYAYGRQMAATATVPSQPVTASPKRGSKSKSNQNRRSNNFTNSAPLSKPTQAQPSRGFSAESFDSISEEGSSGADSIGHTSSSQASEEKPVKVTTVQPTAVA